MPKTGESTLIILAGGEAKRMGMPKHLIPAGEGTILDRQVARLGPTFSETLVVGRGLTDGSAGARLVEDCFPERSPLVGIVSGLRAATTAWSLVIGCDMPDIHPDLPALLLEGANDADIDAVVPVVRGYYEPLCAAYRTTAIDAMESAIACRHLKITAVYETLRVRAIAEGMIRTVDTGLASFANLNTAHDLQRAGLA